MTGNNHPAIVIQERDRHLLGELSMMRVMDREQAKRAGGFGSTTRVNARLLLLTQAGLLRRFYLGTTAGGAKALYALTEKGARLVEAPYRALRRNKEQVLIADFFVQHQLAVNDVYLALKYPRVLVPEIEFGSWRTFQQPLAPGLSLIPDGYTELRTAEGIIAAFIEVDLGHERLSVWKQKVRNYLSLAISGQFASDFGQDRFRVLVVTHSEGRMLSIRKEVAGATEKIFWFTTLGAIQKGEMFGPVWLRPKDDLRQSFVKEPKSS